MLLIVSFSNSLEELLHRQKDDTRCLHCPRDRVCFTAACSSVCKYCSVVAIQHTVQQAPCGSFVDISLGSILIKYTVKAESLIFRSSAIWSGKLGPPLDCMVLRWVEDTAKVSLFHVTFLKNVLTGTCRPPPSAPAECPLISTRELELPQVNHHQGRGGRPAHGSIAQLLGPVAMSLDLYSRAWAERTVNGRTLMATLIEEAPSEAAAMTICVGYTSEKVEVSMTRSPRSRRREERSRYGCTGVSRSYNRCLALRPPVDEIIALYCFKT